jgi:hypothetical protein
LLQRKRVAFRVFLSAIILACLLYSIHITVSQTLSRISPSDLLAERHSDAPTAATGHAHR